MTREFQVQVVVSDIAGLAPLVHSRVGNEAFTPKKNRTGLGEEFTIIASPSQLKFGTLRRHGVRRIRPRRRAWTRKILPELAGRSEVGRLLWYPPPSAMCAGRGSSRALFVLPFSFFPPRFSAIREGEMLPDDGAVRCGRRARQ